MVKNCINITDDIDKIESRKEMMTNATEFSLPYVELVFSVAVERDLTIPDFFGAAVRGSFGKQLRQLGCEYGIERRDCKGCPRFLACAYRMVFEPDREDISEARRNALAQGKLPSPFVLRVPFWRRAQLSPGSDFSYRLVLVGPAVVQRDVVLKAMINAVHSGFGIRSGACRLVGVHQVVGPGKTRGIWSPKRARVEPLLLLSAALDNKERRCGALVIRTMSPIKITAKGSRVSTLTFDILMRAVFRRLDLLGRAYGNGPLNLRFKPLLEDAAKISLVTEGTAAKERKIRRFSYRQEQEIYMDGIQGSFLFDGEVTPFLPYLELARRFGIGKGTSMGLGAFRYRELGGEG